MSDIIVPVDKKSHSAGSSLNYIEDSRRKKN